MYKFFKTILLLAVIALCGAFIYAKVTSFGSDTNYFNSQLRPKADKYPALRTLLGLHYDGDARADILGKRYNKIVIEVDVLDNVTVDTQVLDRFATAVQNITGKPASYVISTKAIPLSNLTDTDVAGIASRYRDLYGNGAADLYVLLADSKKDNPKLLGSTFQEYGIVIYLQSLRSFAQSSSALYYNYEFSTLLHELGHQIGLDHNDIPGCLMNPKAEMNDQPVFDPDFVVMGFCSEEIQQINAQKQAAQ